MVGLQILEWSVSVVHDTEIMVREIQILTRACEQFYSRHQIFMLLQRFIDYALPEQRKVEDLGNVKGLCRRGFIYTVTSICLREGIGSHVVNPKNALEMNNESGNTDIIQRLVEYSLAPQSV